jgi:KTSC domain
MAQHTYRDPATGRFAKEPTARIRTPSIGGRKKVHAGTYVHDEAYDRFQHDLGPWTETPSSSRVSRYRYDYLNRALQVQWRNNKNHGYIYLDMPYEGYRAFARAASKGRHVNSTLNLYEYRLMSVDEVDAPSNDDRTGPMARARA